MIQIFKGFKSTLSCPAPRDLPIFAGRGGAGQDLLFLRGGAHIPDWDDNPSPPPPKKKKKKERAKLLIFKIISVGFENEKTKIPMISISSLSFHEKDNYDDDDDGNEKNDDDEDDDDDDVCGETGWLCGRRRRTVRIPRLHQPPRPPCTCSTFFWISHNFSGHFL